MSSEGKEMNASDWDGKALELISEEKKSIGNE